MQLTTPRLTLREFRLTDFDALYEIQSDAETERFEHPPFPPEKVQQHLQWALADIEKEPRAKYRLAITIRPDDTVRGWVVLTLNNATIREYEIGWTVHRSYWGQGIATEAARAVMRFAFTDLNAHRIVAFCHAENLPSSRVMAKLGMQREGQLRRVRWLNDAWNDELLYSILDHEFSP